MKPKPKLTVEALETRDVPALFGNPWQQAQNLTLSFATDGVAYSNQTWSPNAYTSGLFAALNAQMPTSVWEEELLRAIDAYAAEANINVGLVADSGAAFGPAGLSPGVRPATFRIGAAPNAPDVLALSMPNSPITGGFAGTLMLNDTFAYSAGGGNGTYDLYSIALHEVGNLLGLRDSDEVGSPRYGHYMGVRTGLTVNDVSELRAMYGVRPADVFEGASGNDTLTTATALAGGSDPAAAGKTRVVADGDITAAGDADCYRFTPPAGTTSFTVRLGTAGKSLLAGRIDVFDAAGNLIGSQTSSGPLQGDTTLTLTGLQPGATYTVKVSAGRTDAFKTGAYQLRVGFGYDPVTETEVGTVQQFVSPPGTNSTPATAAVLAPTAGYAAGSHYEWNGAIGRLFDSDYFRLTAPAGGGVMTLTVLAAQHLPTSATVFDSSGQVVAEQVLLNWEGGMYRAQVPDTVAGATYYVLLNAQAPDRSAWTGTYTASVDFSQPLAAAQQLASGVADQNSQIAVGIDVQESGAFRFNLSAASSDPAAVNRIEVFIFDMSGAIVASWAAGDESGTQVAFLEKGQYTIQIKQDYNYASSATIAYDLGLNRLTDPIDPFAPVDPTAPGPFLPPLSPPPPPPSNGEPGVIIILPPFIPWLP